MIVYCCIFWVIIDVIVIISYSILLLGLPVGGVGELYLFPVELFSVGWVLWCLRCAVYKSYVSFI